MLLIKWVNHLLLLMLLLLLLMLLLLMLMLLLLLIILHVTSLDVVEVELLKLSDYHCGESIIVQVLLPHRVFIDVLVVIISILR